MEFLPVKLGRKRRRHRGKRDSLKVKLSLKTSKRRKLCTESPKIYEKKEKVINSNMQADTFWKNYSISQEWQKRHNVAWWKSRCMALEFENKTLKNKLKEIASCSTHKAHNETESDLNVNQSYENEDEDEKLEFQVDEEMMRFLEQSIRHKMELQEKRELESSMDTEAEESQTFEGTAASIRARNQGAKLLYGDASARILGMETALQATLDRHKDMAKPQYWPNINLRL
ncbi:uncharacterized protein F10E9.5 [Prorops nasuta]|uniref:uncharacterized protein F10E9.5 n=1 Tax=Prorops nasuta TaxID=863751 RepID=UPI0034CD29F6